MSSNPCSTPLSTWSTPLPCGPWGLTKDIDDCTGRFANHRPSGQVNFHTLVKSHSRLASSLCSSFLSRFSPSRPSYLHSLPESSVFVTAWSETVGLASSREPVRSSRGGHDSWYVCVFHSAGPYCHERVRNGEPPRTLACHPRKTFPWPGSRPNPSAAERPSCPTADVFQSHREGSFEVV